MAMQGKAHDGIPAGMIEKVWHSSLQGTDARGFDPKTQLEGGWNATFAILVSRDTFSSQLIVTDTAQVDQQGLCDAPAALAQVLRRECLADFARPDQSSC